ncbi:MAG: hypothetical protein AMXMBFR74_02710 [Parvibaculum sp.]|uniref:cation transporter n=1 Tax=Parvibaculum sp. TaxID=2024848 RepID=UPI0035BA5AC0
MSGQCCDHEASEAQLRDTAYRRVLWAALAINFIMFAIEIGAGLAAGSVALQADALDFLGDTATYAISLFVIGMSLRARALAALAKGGAMALLGFWVAGATVWHVAYGGAPEAFMMGAVGLAALTANAAVFVLLWRYRSGDSNMRSVWLCSRNDVIGNCAVLLAALGVFGTGTAWPDIAVAAVMSTLALQGAWAVFRQALGELRESRLSGSAQERTA